MENNKNKKSVKFQGDILIFCDFIQVFVFTRNHHLNKEDFNKVLTVLMDLGCLKIPNAKVINLTYLFNINKNLFCRMLLVHVDLRYLKFRNSQEKTNTNIFSFSAKCRFYL